MDIVSAVAKVRFGSARPQHVQLHKGQALAAELICMEARQSVKVSGGERAYYVIMGSAVIAAGGESSPLAPGQFAATAPEEAHTVTNAGEGRLVCLALRLAK